MSPSPNTRETEDEVDGGHFSHNKRGQESCLKAIPKEGTMMLQSESWPLIGSNSSGDKTNCSEKEHMTDGTAPTWELKNLNSCDIMGITGAISKDNPSASSDSFEAGTSATSGVMPCVIEASGPTHSQDKLNNFSSTERMTQHTQASSSSSPCVSFTKMRTSSGGARPKTIKSHKKPKRVQFSDNVQTNICLDETQFDQYRNLCLALRIPANTTVIKAVEFMLDKECSHYKTLITLACNKLRVSLNRFPNAFELYKDIMDYDFNEKRIIMSFINECQTEKGHAILNSLMNGTVDHKKQEQEHQDEASHTEQSTKRQREQEHTKKDFSSDPKIQALQREQELLKRKLTCVSCKVRPTEVIFLPCGHVSLCAICSESKNICPICNRIALGEVKIYLS